MILLLSPDAFWRLTIFVTRGTKGRYFKIENDIDTKSHVPGGGLPIHHSIMLDEYIYIDEPRDLAAQISATDKQKNKTSQ